MQPERNFRTALLAAIASLGNLAGCTGYLERSDNGAPSSTSATGASSQIDATSGAPTISASQGDLTAPGGSAAPSDWLGAVGTWCGPSEQQTLWLTAKPGASACADASQKLYTQAGDDSSEGLTLQLDPLALTTFPAVLDVAARYCGSAAACSDVRASLHVESYTPGQGMRGSWAVTPPGQTKLGGRLDASWCNWDDVLPAHPAAERLARDIKIQEVSVYQGVKVPIVRDLAAVAPRNADLVQRREALVRVFVQPAPGFQSRPLSARITLQNEGQKPRHFEQIINVSGASTEQDGASTFNIDLPKDAFDSATLYAVELRETSRCTALGGTPVGARFPETGMAAVGARATGPVKVMLVPVRYETDGSGRLPDLSPTQLELMTRRLYSMYPTSEVVLSVRDVVGTDRVDLSDMLDQMRELRATDAPPTDVSYYGMVRQAETFVDYCQGACTTGIAGFGSMSGTAATGMGVGFPDTAAGTFIHELGHIYRRPHAPCGGAGAPDESYPYPDAKLGSWGYDFQTRELFDPQTHVDFMSYCSADWISDYNYQLILERIIVVNQLASFKRVIAPGAPTTFRSLRVKDGQARWGLDLSAAIGMGLPGDPIRMKALDGQGVLVEEFAASFEDQPDGEQVYFVPAGRAAWHAIQVPGGAAVPYAGATHNRPFSR